MARGWTLLLKHWWQSRKRNVFWMLLNEQSHICLQSKVLAHRTTAYFVCLNVDSLIFLVFYSFFYVTPAISFLTLSDITIFWLEMYLAVSCLWQSSHWMWNQTEKGTKKLKGFSPKSFATYINYSICLTIILESCVHLICSLASCFSLSLASLYLHVSKLKGFWWSKFSRRHLFYSSILGFVWYK